MLKLDYFLDLVKDGAWHNLTDLSHTLGLSMHNLTQLSTLLAGSNIAEYDPQANRVRLQREWITLIQNTETDEEPTTPALGTIVLPPKKTINLQNIQITNLTETELELGVRVNKELEELAIGLMKLTTPK
jgi:hypothetical protein